MKDKDIKNIINSIDKEIELTNKMFEEGHSHAYIVGHLQGTLDIIKMKLESQLTKNEK